MSDVITKPGFYKQQNGGKAEIVGKCHDGMWYGRTERGYPERWHSSGKQNPPCQFVGDIVSPWPPEPPVKPFRISDHGPGVYETRDGRETPVHACLDTEAWHRWSGTFSYGDNGGLFSDGSVSPDDLVRYLRPIPKPAVDPGEGWRLLGDEESPQLGDEFGFREYVSGGHNWLKYDIEDYHFGKTLKRIREFQSGDFFVRRRVIPQPEWTPTNEMRLAKTVFDDPLGTWYGKGVESQWLRIEQRWTNGTDSEWRPVTVEGA